MKTFSKILWGLVLIGIGAIVALNALGITNINIFFDGWWTLFIIIPCTIGLFSGKGIGGNIVGIIIGVLLLLGCQHYLNFNVVWKMILPIILVGIGLSILFGTVFNNKISKRIKEIEVEAKDGEKTTYNATFSGQKIDYAGKTFKGCDIEAVFGGVKLDLTKAKITKDVVINAKAIFGGVDITVPDNVDIKVSSNSILGGVGDKFKSKPDAKVTVYLNATCMFGGVDIK